MSDIFGMMFGDGGFDDYEDYSYLMGSPPDYSYMPGLEQMNWLAPLMDTVLDRGMYNERGGYQDPYQPHYHVLRHIQNVLGKDWARVLGLEGEMEPEPVKAFNPYESMFMGSSLLQKYLENMEEGLTNPTAAARDLKAKFDAEKDPNILSQMLAQLPMNADGTAVDWSQVTSLFKDWAKEQNKIDAEYDQAMREFESRPQYGFEERDLAAEKRQSRAEESADRIIAKGLRRPVPVKGESGVTRWWETAQQDAGPQAPRAADAIPEPMRQIGSAVGAVADEARRGSKLDNFLDIAALVNPGSIIGRMASKAFDSGTRERVAEGYSGRMKPPPPSRDGKQSARRQPAKRLETREEIVQRLTTPHPQFEKTMRKRGGRPPAKTRMPRRDTAAALERAVLMSQLAQRAGMQGR
jgi:hypothetical protein